ncbi:MAG: OsmC family protein [Anaerolineales bacterium]|nr:OsmC family protein [Anaerolineales bacterium]
MDAKVTWKKEGLLFDATADTGGTVRLASSLDGDAEGFRPMELMAMSLVGCTSMDVMSILQKMRQDVSAFETRVHTEKVDEHPKVWNTAVVEYIVTGRNIDPKAVERAIQLSKERYCPAQAMLGKAVEIELKYTIIEAE